MFDCVAVLIVQKAHLAIQFYVTDVFVKLLDA